VRLENDHLVAFVQPSRGGHLYELDVRQALTNVLNTLDRRLEPYHESIAAAAGLSPPQDDQPVFTPDRVILKQEGLDRLLVYDRYPRKALVDHVYPLDLSLDDLIAGRDVERGDFVQGAYLSKVQRTSERVSLLMERSGQADVHTIRVRKSIELSAGSPTLEVRYTLDDLPEGVPVHFAVEINLAAMAGHADDRYYSDASRKRLGMLDSRLDLVGQAGLTLTDLWLDLFVAIDWSRSGGLWCFPIETVSQSEGGFEAVYQSSAVIPHWVITADHTRRWELRLGITVGRPSDSAPRVGESAASDELVETAAGD
jgi:hypothetical protein